VFAPSKPFQPSAVLAGKAGAYQSEAPFKFSTLGQFPDLALKHYTRLERLSRSKRSSVEQKFVTYHRKKFYNIRPWYGLIFLSEAKS
jgi:hypothetical protein